MLCLLNIPIALLAAIWIGFKQVLISKKLGVSATMIEVVGGRFTMDLFASKRMSSLSRSLKDCLMQVRTDCVFSSGPSICTTK